MRKNNKADLKWFINEKWNEWHLNDFEQEFYKEIILLVKEKKILFKLLLFSYKYARFYLYFFITF